VFRRWTKLWFGTTCGLIINDRINIFGWMKSLIYLEMSKFLSYQNSFLCDTNCINCDRSGFVLCCLDSREPALQDFSRKLDLHSRSCSKLYNLLATGHNWSTCTLRLIRSYPRTVLHLLNVVDSSTAVLVQSRSRYWINFTDTGLTFTDMFRIWSITDHLTEMPILCIYCLF